ncbi:MAG TPA: SAM-dependent chlorinase/fluorinase [Polyangiales bacterium]|nr:SAM-dependent chlorinase/fluorinase [Polyangiales bacterium]
MRRLVTLTTDFGTRDAYVAQMKGVLYARGPSDIEVVDLSHELGAQQIFEAALFVRDAWPRFPAGTIHVVVVDPGVGSTRRALVCSHAGQLMVGPDNGVMSLALATEPELVVLEPERWIAAPLSATFHGRDLFAPAAARLAAGALPQDLGTRTEQLVRLRWPCLEVRSSELRGQVLHVDRFGNLISNISRADVTSWLAPEHWQRLRVTAAGSGELPLLRTYADAAVGSGVALFGSSELLEVAVTNGSAATLLGAAVGAEVILSVVPQS